VGIVFLASGNLPSVVDIALMAEILAESSAARMVPKEAEDIEGTEGCRILSAEKKAAGGCRAAERKFIQFG
jgi:hypothetical protein